MLVGKDISDPEVDFVRVALPVEASLYEDTGFACGLNRMVAVTQIMCAENLLGSLSDMSG